MYRNGAALFFYAETALHPGSGSAIGTADLPVQRERTTGYPVISATGIKGALRAWYEEATGLAEKRRQARVLRERQKQGPLSADQATALAQLEREIAALEARVHVIFGPPPGRASDHAGSLAFTEARVLLFPVRALNDLFVWITSPHVLQRMKRELALAGVSVPWDPPATVPAGECLLGTSCPAAPAAAGTDRRQLVLEEYPFVEDATRPIAQVDQIAGWIADHVLPNPDGWWRSRLFSADGPSPRCGLVILSDADFREFTELATEVITRIRVNSETGTVEQTGLWTEEHLPAETLLYAIMLPADPRSQNDASLETATDVLRAVVERARADGWDLLQLGGDETVGKGLVRIGAIVAGERSGAAAAAGVN